MRTVIEAMFNKLKTKNVAQINAFADKILPSVYTNITTGDIISMVPSMAKYKEGENDTKAQCKNDCNAKYVTSNINISCSFFLSSDLRKCNLKSLKTDSKPKEINRKDQLINSNLMCTDHSCKKYSIIEADES